MSKKKILYGDILMDNKEIDAYKEWIVVNKRCLELISEISEFFHKKSK